VKCPIVGHGWIELGTNQREVPKNARAGMGELLQATERANGGEQYHRGSTHSGRELVPTLAELGVTLKESMDAQARSRCSCWE
jgi:hypothetical protein